MKKIDIKSFGVIGDGSSDDTAAIQHAIDICADQGNTLSFSAGNYYTGTLFLKSGLHLILEKDAVLLGSTDLSTYHACSPFVDAVGVTRGRALVVAYNVENLLLEGSGTINGNGEHVVCENDRPFLFHIEKCRNVTLQGIRLEGSVSWCLHIDRCKDVVADHITIFNRGMVNNDGIDIDASENVLITGCDLNCGDDAICLKTTSVNPCRNVHVKNCRVCTNWGAFKIGTESCGDFSDIVIEDCHFYDVMGGGIKIVPVDGGSVDNVIIRNITMTNCTGPIFIANGTRNRAYVEHRNAQFSKIRNVLIENITADVISAPVRGVHFGEVWGNALGGVLLSGTPEAPLEDITLRNLKLDLPGGFTDANHIFSVREMEDMYPEFHRFDPVPAKGVYIRHGAKIHLESLQLCYKAEDCRAEMYTEDVFDFTNE